MVHQPGRFQEQNVLVLADRAADLNDGDVCPRFARRPLDSSNNLFGDVRHHLDALAAVLEVSFALDHRLVDPAGRHVVHPHDVGVEEAFVVTDVLVSFITVFRHEHLTVLRRIHRAGINVDVRIHFDGGYLVAARLEDLAD